MFPLYPYFADVVQQSDTTNMNKIEQYQATATGNVRKDALCTVYCEW